MDSFADQGKLGQVLAFAGNNEEKNGFPERMSQNWLWFLYTVPGIEIVLRVYIVFLYSMILN